MLLLLVDGVKLHDLNWLRLIVVRILRSWLVLVILDHDAIDFLFVSGLSKGVCVIFYFRVVLKFY